MLIETQVVRSKSELPKELQGLPVSKAVIYRKVDRKAWEQIAKEHAGMRVVVVTPGQLSTPRETKMEATYPSPPRDFLRPGPSGVDILHQ